MSSGNLRGNAELNEGRGFMFLWNEMNLQSIVRSETKIWVADYDPIMAETRNDSKWHHILMTWSQTNGTKTYQDGKLVTNSMGTVNETAFLSTGASKSFINVGGMYSYSHNFVQYNVHDIKLWRYQLDSNDVKELYEPGMFWILFCSHHLNFTLKF